MNPLLEKLKKSAQKEEKNKELLQSKTEEKIEEKLQKMVEEKTKEMNPSLFKKEKLENSFSEKKIEEKRKPFLFARKQKPEQTAKEKPVVCETNPKKSIISLVQQMVKDGMSEHEILSSLKEMGVEEQQAKRLVLLGYSDTFNIIKKEIDDEMDKIVSAEKEKVLEDIQKRIQQMENQSKAKMESEFDAKKKNLTQDIERKFGNLEQKIESNFSVFLEDLKTTKGEMVDVKINQRKIDRNLQELQAIGIGKRNKILAYFLVFMGVLFSVVSSYLGFSFLTTFSIEVLVVVIATALLGITFLFISTMV